jgi:putative oxidoreductase
MIAHMNTVLLVGRIILGGFFFCNGVNHFLRFGMMAQYARTKGVPFPAIAQGITGLMLLCGGLSIVCGVAPGSVLPCSEQRSCFWHLLCRGL